MRRALFPVCLVALTACGSTVLHEVPFRTLTPHDRDVPLYAEAVPDAAYVDAGLVQALGYGADSSGEHLQHALKEAGRHMGCDAIARVRVDGTDTGEGHAVGVCILWVR